MAAHRSVRHVEYETISVLQLQETAKAFLVVDDNDNEYWLPKSQIEVLEVNSRDEMTIKLPTWIRETKNKELVEYTRAQFAKKNEAEYKARLEKIASWKRAIQGNGL